MNIHFKVWKSLYHIRLASLSVTILISTCLYCVMGAAQMIGVYTVCSSIYGKKKSHVIFVCKQDMNQYVGNPALVYLFCMLTFFKSTFFQNKFSREHNPSAKQFGFRSGPTVYGS